jgi:hypothetical protein
MDMPNIFLLPRFSGRPIRLAVALALLLPAGCANVTPLPEPSPSEHHDDPYVRSDLDELLGFGAGLDGKTPSDRAGVCRTLLKRQKEASSPGTQTGLQLHLMTARLFSDACGDIAKILNGVDSLPARDLPDGRVRQWVAVQTQALKRMDSLSRRLVGLGRKQKLPRREHASEPDELKIARKSKCANGPQNIKARALLDKLEAIRSMEERLDESGEGS